MLFGVYSKNVVRTTNEMVIFMPYKLNYILYSISCTVCVVQVSMKTAVLRSQFHWSIILGVLGSLTTSTWVYSLHLYGPTYHTSNLLKLSKQLLFIAAQNQH